MATVAVVGAGIAGLTCGKLLQAQGHQVVWLEKSRGVGGRMATRRLGSGAWADHGLRHWPTSADELTPLTEELIQEGLLRPWSAQGFLWQDAGLTRVNEPVYGSEKGVNAIAKYLAQAATIKRQQRVTAITKTTDWQLTTTGPNQEKNHICADAVVLAIPAPQAQALLTKLAPQTATALEAVAYAPCLSVMATYAALPDVPQLEHHQGWHITPQHPTVAWISLDSSKPTVRSGHHVVVIQSQANFASQYFQQLDSCGQHTAAMDHLQQTTITQLLSAAGQIVPGIEAPTHQQLQRWRYSTVTRPYPEPFFPTTPWPSLVGCGDWCATTSSQLTAAYTSGQAAARHLLATL